MINPDNRLSCRLDGLAVSTREQQRMLVMAELGLLESEMVPVFEEATQTAAHFLGVPICLLALMEPERQRFKSAVGLSRLGLMNELANSRQFPRSESFCAHVVDSQQALVINDTLDHPTFASSILSHQYGVRAYLGVPLITSEGCCIGSLAIMDLAPRSFGTRDVEFLELTARWSMSEYERRRTASPWTAMPLPIPSSPIPPGKDLLANQLGVELLSQLTQELRSPLTSVMGMASVLLREIYGSLTKKQREYLEIIHNSGQYLLSLVNEILELSTLKENFQELNLVSLDIEMLCQQAINSLEHACLRREQQIRLSIEPGRRIWLLDKDKVRQMLYHLIFNLLQSSAAGSVIRVHVSRKGNTLNIAIWVSHPWLGEGLPYVELHSLTSLVSTGANTLEMELYHSYYEAETDSESPGKLLVNGSTPTAWFEAGETSSEDASPSLLEASATNNLGFRLSCQLAEMHSGQIIVQGGVEAGLRYVISLPQPDDAEEG
jgi:hypothetical protein